MSSTNCKDTYIQQLDSLKNIILSSKTKISADPPDVFFSENVNFFTKSFLVTMCAYLESYIKDSLMVIIDDANEKLKQSKLPRNLIKWSLNPTKELKASELKFEELTLEIDRQSLDEHVSGSPYRTMHLFQKFGIELERENRFRITRDKINSIVVKRNKILHHNDEASDVTHDDLIDYISSLREYISFLDEIVSSRLS